MKTKLVLKLKLLMVIVIFAGAAAFLAPGSAWASLSNVALNKPVSVVQGSANIFNTTTPLGVITDGVFTPEDTGYLTLTAASEAVEWENASPSTIFQINLGGDYLINGAIAQCDDNDSYLLQYHDLSTGTWDTLWTIPSVSVGFGLRTRPNADQTTWQTVPTVTTDAVRLSGASGDIGFAVSELQLRGEACPVPETSTIFLLAAGLLGLVAVNRKFRMQN